MVKKRENQLKFFLKICILHERYSFEMYDFLEQEMLSVNLFKVTECNKLL